MRDDRPAVDLPAPAKQSYLSQFKTSLNAGPAVKRVKLAQRAVGAALTRMAALQAMLKLQPVPTAGPAARRPPIRTPRIVRPGSAPGAIQRVIKGYKAGTLAKTTVVMRGLNPAQRRLMQILHDESDLWNRDDAREYVLEQEDLKDDDSEPMEMDEEDETSNKYTWEVDKMTSFITSNPAVQNVLENFGHPTTDVVKVYGDLASRVGFDVGSDRKGVLADTTVSDLWDHFDASEPLHLAMNGFLHEAWKGNLEAYGGSKKKIPLYSVMRSKMSGEFKKTLINQVSLNDVLREVSGRPAELHHLLFKKHYPGMAADARNLMLTERSKREKEFGPGQHELMHMVASGNDKDKFNKLLAQYVSEYQKWLTKKFG